MKMKLIHDYISYFCRFIVVCKPLEARSICTIRRTRIIIVLVCLFGLTFNLTRFLELKHVWFQVPVDINEKQISETEVMINIICSIVKTIFRINQNGYADYSIWLCTILLLDIIQRFCSTQQYFG